MTRSKENARQSTDSAHTTAPKLPHMCEDLSQGGRPQQTISRARWLRATRRIRELAATVKDLSRENRRLKLLAYHDHLTGLLNRRGFEERLGLALESLSGERPSLAVILLDLDDLKQINDTGGHFAGDAALRSVADALRRGVRQYDHIARVGGDEFAVLLPGMDATRASAIADRVRQDLQRSSSLAGHNLTVSAGVSEVLPADPPERRADLLLDRADRALYAAKRAGRDRTGSLPRSACSS